MAPSKKKSPKISSIDDVTDRAIETICSGIDTSPIPDDAKSEACALVRSNQQIYEQCRGLQFKAPQARAEWQRRITFQVIGDITSILSKYDVDQKDGTAVYAHIYAHMRGENPKEYL